MSKKDDITVIAVKTLYHFMFSSNVDWDQAYFRFYSANKSHSSFEFTYRKGRKLSLIDSDPACDDVLDSLMHGLFDELEVESRQRPMVAVLSVDKDKNFNMKFDYQNPRGLEIGYIGMGKATSYYQNNEVDIPEHVRDYQNELAKKGVVETPILYEGRKEQDE